MWDAHENKQKNSERTVREQCASAGTFISSGEASNSRDVGKQKDSHDVSGDDDDDDDDDDNDDDDGVNDIRDDND